MPCSVANCSNTQFGLEGLLHRKIEYEVDTSELQEVVHRDGGTGVLLFGKFSLQLHEKADLQGFHLVNVDSFAWLG